MPVNIKPHKCLGCFTDDPDEFYSRQKSWCKICTHSRICGRAISNYKCRECGTEKESNFYGYLKCICKRCKSVQSRKKVKKVKIVILPYPDEN